MEGQKFGRLTVIARWGKRGAQYTWHCKCDCGGEKVATTKSLRCGDTRSCGCLLKETHKNNSINNQTHGMSKTRIFGRWQMIRTRCYNPNFKSYKDYGGRGIKMCNEWKDDFVAFFKHVGLPPGPRMSIDRIDNNKGYEPGNVRWATIKQQNSNRRNNVNLTYKGETKILSEWAKEFGMKRETIKDRLRLGWTVEEALTLPVQKMNWDRAHLGR